MDKKIIPVTKPYLPSREKLGRYIDDIYDRRYLTNNGPLVKELASRLESYLGVDNILLVSNGTLALQVAYRALDINKGLRSEAITTPFSFVATASSLKWEGIRPVFSDINKESWNLDPLSIEARISRQTRALVPVHVFGNACDVEKIQAVADRYNLKIVYDASHAFGVNYKGESLLNWGDASTLSFHATKVFHTIEGGAIIFRSRDDFNKSKRLINFGINDDGEIESLGINAKMNEFQAAMGLCVLDEIARNLKNRKEIWSLYYEKFQTMSGLKLQRSNSVSNYAYFPVLLESEKILIRVKGILESKGITPRRYFYPSLDSVREFSDGELPCLISKSISERIICLPIYDGMSLDVASKVISVVKSEVYD